MVYMGFVGGIRRRLPLNFFSHALLAPLSASSPHARQVKHPNFGGFSQGIEIGLEAVAFMDLLEGFVEFCA